MQAGLTSRATGGLSNSKPREWRAGGRASELPTFEIMPDYWDLHSTFAFLISAAFI
jgi:hypothetical protein